MKNNVSMTKSSLVKKVLNEQVYLLSRLAWMEAISEMTKATACLTMSAADLRAARSELAQAVGALLTVDLAESAMELEPGEFWASLLTDFTWSAKPEQESACRLPEALEAEAISLSVVDCRLVRAFWLSEAVFSLPVRSAALELQEETRLGPWLDTDLQVA